MGAACQFIGKPVLIIKPMMNPKYSKEKGPHFLFEKSYLYKGEEHMNVADIKICFVFNGLNYYAPFYQSDVARLIRSGTGTLKNISTVTKDLRKLMEKIPCQASINVGMKQLLLYLDASECIVLQTRLSCGFCPTQVTTTLEIPGVVTPMVEGTVRRRKHLITDAFQDESPQKKEHVLKALV